MTRHLVMMFVLAMIWSSAFMAIKVAVVTIPPLTLAAARIVIAAIVLYAAARWQGHRLPAGARFWTFCFLLGLIGNGLPFTLIGWGEQRITSSLTAILMSVMPLATVVMAHFFTTGDRMTAAKLVGVGLGFGGVMLLVGPGALGGLGGDVLHELSVAGGALCYAVAVILARNTPESPLLARSAAMMIMGCVIMVPAALIVDAPWTVVPDGGSLLAALYLGLFPTAFATIIFFHLVQARGASIMAYINYMIPMFGVFWGWALLGETITGSQAVALVVILAGMAVAQIPLARRLGAPPA